MKLRSDFACVEAAEVAAAIVYLAAPATYTIGISLRLDGGTSSVRIVR